MESPNLMGPLTNLMPTKNSNTRQFPNYTDAPNDQFPEILCSPLNPDMCSLNSTEALQPQNNSLKHKTFLTHKTNSKLCRTSPNTPKETSQVL